MNFVKMNFKLIIGIIIGVIFISGISVYATTTYLANQVTYTTGKNTNIQNVSDALNDLYSKVNSENSIKLASIKGTIFNATGGNFWTVIENLTDYKTLVIGSRTRDSVAGTTYYVIRGIYNDENNIEQREEVLKTTDTSSKEEQFNIEKYNKIEFAVECTAAASGAFYSNYAYNNVRITK